MVKRDNNGGIILSTSAIVTIMIVLIGGFVTFGLTLDSRIDAVECKQDYNKANYENIKEDLTEIKNQISKLDNKITYLKTSNKKISKE